MPIKTIYRTGLFLALLFILNNILFLPHWIGKAVQSNIFADIEGSSSWGNWWTALSFFSFKLLSLDFLVLLLPVLLIPKDSVFKRIYVPIVGICYLLLLYYQIYFEGYQNLYGVHPTFQIDWVIIKEILPIFFREISIQKSNYLLGILGWIIGSVGLWTGVYFLQNLMFQLKKEKIFWWGIGLVLIGNFLFNKNIQNQEISEKINSTANTNELEEETEMKQDTSYSFFNWTYPNIITSATFDEQGHLEHLKKRWIYDLYMDKKLVQKPNIHLIFIESYGAVATLADYCEPLFSPLANQLDSQLIENGWTIASSYSKSSVIGGRSWLGMTSALIGGRIEDQVQYSELINNQQTFPHMVDYFNAQEYETYKVSTMAAGKGMDSMKMVTIPNRFWGFDHHLMFGNIPYKGYRYDWYGGIPDQYTLSYLMEEVFSKETKPYFVSLITMSSHAPWSNSPPIVNNWRSLDTLLTPYTEERPTKSMHIINYWDAMDYQLKVVTETITKYGKEGDVFIVLGDHQPGALEWKLAGRFNKWATPIHVIAKDSAFVQSFHQHGFTSGMEVDTSQFTIMRHMGLYSLLTRQLLENYGTSDVVLPEYLPWGLKDVPKQKE